jgi:hypothetical protein
MSADATTAPAAPGGLLRLRILTRHFFRRFFENDLISPGGDAHVGLSHVIGAFITPGFLVVILVLLKYALVHTTWRRVIELGIDDALLYVALSMIVLGIAATITWDAFFLDARDHHVLGVLPVGHRLLAAAKLGALGMFLGIFAAAANLVPTLLVPILMLQRADDATFTGHFVPLTVAHGAATLLSGAWAVLAVVAIRGGLAVILPPGRLRRFGPLVQGALILVLLAWFVSLPQFLASGKGIIAAGGWWRDASPPMWFLGLYETIIGQPQPAYHSLARTALAATAVTLVAVVVLVFALPARRTSDAASAVVLSGRGRSAVEAMRRLGAFLLGHPRARASLSFTVAGLARSTSHRLYLAAAVGAGLAWSFSGVFWLYGRSGMPGLHEPDVATLAIQPILLLFVIVAIRFAVTIPVALPANWMFRLTERTPVQHDFDGVRATALVAGVAVVAALVPVHRSLWAWDVTAYHACLGLLYTGFIVALFFSAQNKFPFTAAYMSGSIKLKSRWLLYLAGLWTLTGIPALMEQQVFRYGRFAVLLPLALIVVTVVLSWWRRRREADLPGLVFDEQPDDVPQSLELFM